MRKILAAAAVAFLAVSVFAQSAAITGTVTDESGGTLPGATVVVTGPGGSRTGFSGSDGKYSIVPTGNGPYKVSVSMPSFASQHKDGVAAGADSSFTMKIAGLGETVVVSASKVESTLANAPVTMSVVSAATLATAPSQNFGDILRNVPGVNVIQTSARDVNLSMRQGTSTLATSTLVLLDGRSIYLDFFGFVLWDLVPSNPSDIKQIEVVRGPASAVWGANALTGVVNILTKTPRENPNTTVYFSAGTFGTKGGSRQGSEDHYSFGGGISFAKAINDKWSTRLIAGYVNSDPYSRPTGRIPVIQDPRVTGACNGTPGTANCIGGLQYPLDGPGAGNFENDGTKQPKFDVRLDQDMSNGGRLTYSAGYSGTTGIIHTGIGPFNIQSGSYLGYGRIGYSKGALKVAAFGNLLDVEAPNLLLIDPNTLKPVDLNFKTQTYDFEIGHSKIVAEKHVLSYGGNARRNQFDITLAPGAEDRNEFGGYFQDEFFVDKFRLTVGGRVDKFGNIDKAVFSPRVTAMFKPTADQSFRVSFNKAFRSPSAVNNYLNQDIFTPTTVNLSALAPLAPLAPAAVRPALTTPFNFIVKNVGNPNLKQESVTAYEVAYTGTFKDKTTIGIALYRNETDDNINFASIQPSASFPAGIPPFDVYTPRERPGRARHHHQRRARPRHAHRIPEPDRPHHSPEHSPAPDGVLVFEPWSAAAGRPRIVDRSPLRPSLVGVGELFVPEEAQGPHREVRPDPVPQRRSGLACEEPVQRQHQLEHRASRRHDPGELSGQGAVDRRPHLHLPRLHRVVHHGERQHRREVEQGQGRHHSQGREPPGQEDPAARVRRRDPSLRHL